MSAGRGGGGGGGGGVVRQEQVEDTDRVEGATGGRRGRGGRSRWGIKTTADRTEKGGPT